MSDPNDLWGSLRCTAGPSPARDRGASVRPGTLADAWEDMAGQTRAPGLRDLVAERRAYMAGALDALTLLRSGVAAEQLLAECVQFGRAIGTAAERAQTTHSQAAA